MATLLIEGPVIVPPRVPAGGIALVSWKTRNAITGALAAPATASLIQVQGPNGVEFLAIAAVTATTTGTYDYGLAFASTAKTGRYRITITTTGDVAKAAEHYVEVF